MKDFSPIFRGTIENGKLELFNQEAYLKYLQSLKGEIELVVRRRKRRRSSNQNSYYWGVVIPILSETFGYESEEMHEALKLMFLKKEGKLPTLRSTSSLSTIEFMEYIDKIIRWAAQESIVIPDPSTVEI